MSEECQHCATLHWKAELLSTSRKNNILFRTCCNSGHIQLPPLKPPPDIIWALFTNQDRTSNEFCTNIQQYNNAFAFTSLGVPKRQIVTHNHHNSDPYSLQIQDKLCHWSGSLTPTEGEVSVFTQLYIYNPTNTLTARQCNNPKLNPLTLQTLQDVLWDSHPYAAIYQHAHKLLQQDGFTNFSIRLHCVGDKQPYNIPVSNKVAVIIPGNEDAEATGSCDIILHQRTNTNTLQSLYDAHPAYSCLHYVLLFPTSQHGWHWNLHMQGPPPCHHKRQDKEEEVNGQAEEE